MYQLLIPLVYIFQSLISLGNLVTLLPKSLGFPVNRGGEKGVSLK